MKRTMIYLPDDTHQGLRKLAFEGNTSIAELIRKAVEAVYGEDIEDIRDMEAELADDKVHPESAIEFDEYLRRKKVNVPR
jgi:predicted DNA-binding protein